jgi:serine-type D-Ala-D-Ala carboxypeptidase/endopeptidase (penicillin-binding protein 4)
MTPSPSRPPQASSLGSALVGRRFGRIPGAGTKARGRIPLLALLVVTLVLGNPELVVGQSVGGEAGSLSARIDAVLSRPPMDGVHWGVLLVDAETGEVLYDRNAHLRFVPASNMKVPVTAAALDRLGPSWRYRTGFWIEPGALLEEGRRLAGDLVLVTHGDPSLGEPFHTSGEGALRALADSLLATGLREVDGDLVVDLAAWDSTSVPTGWLVGNLNSRAAATGGAFSIENGELELHLRGGTREGEATRLSWSPVGTPDFVANRVTTGRVGAGADVRTSYLPESRRWVVEGSIPPGASERIVRAHRDPVRQAAHALVRVLADQGLEIRGELHLAWDRGEALAGGCAAGSLPRCDGVRELAGMDSPPMTELVRAILEPSQNWMTEQLVRTLGAEVGEEGSWEEGFGVVADFLTGELGIDSLDVHFRDGSGLAGYNLISPRALIRILDDARSRPWALAFHDAMAEPGKPRTTLSNRLTDLEGRVHAKTGTISHVNSLSGYLVSNDGRPLLFAVMSNAANLPAGQIRRTIDDVVREMARR